MCRGNFGLPGAFFYEMNIRKLLLVLPMLAKEVILSVAFMFPSVCVCLRLRGLDIWTKNVSAHTWRTIISRTSLMVMVIKVQNVKIPVFSLVSEIMVKGYGHDTKFNSTYFPRLRSQGSRSKQGCHQSARFEFPAFPWLFQRFFPWLSLTSRHRSDGYHVKSRAKRGKILHLQPLGFC